MIPGFAAAAMAVRQLRENDEMRKEAQKVKKQVMNPYLPLNEYIPDGEPYVLDGRVYIFGSHDEAGGTIYCPGHHMSWSAPVEDLSDWRCDGISYRRDQDPSNPEDELYLWAPDVAKGVDGRYYRYYCFNFRHEIGVAVSGSPAGPYEFLGHIKYADGSLLTEYLPFDPAVFVDDDGRAYLYYGFSPVWKNPQFPIEPSPGCMVAELEPDMVTLKGEPKMCAPGGLRSAGTGFEGHAFFEASSMRKIGGTYYLVYSSELSHELCYATSKYPDRDFAYGGTIVSNGDIGLNGRTTAVNMTGNNHGGLVEINGQWYIFYHRQTHATESSRQGCAEKITILPDGSIPQVEITSCGLNDGPLVGKGAYSAAYVCHLTGGQQLGKMIFGQDRKSVQPYIYEEREDLHYIANVTDGTVFGWKYFSFEELNRVTLTVRGKAAGKLEIYDCDPESGALPIGSTGFSTEGDGWAELPVELAAPLNGTHPLYVRCCAEGRLEVLQVCFG